MRNVLIKVAVTNFVSDPICFYPTFYTMKEATHTGQLTSDTFSVALGRYRENCLLDWRNSWALWVPAYTAIYGFIPPHLRMGGVAAVSFAYVSILSYTRGAFEDEG